MAGKSDYYEAEVLKWATGQTNALGTAPTPYISLFTTAPTDAGGGTEVTGGSYARVTGAAKFGAPTGTTPTQVANSAEVTFAQATANWGTITAFGIHTAITAGNLLYWGTLSASKTVGTNETARFDVGALVITED
jgi:hypothetical protein